jgi:hypothetical protein
MLAKQAAYSFIGMAQAQEAPRPRPTKIIGTKIEGHTVLQRQKLSDNACVDVVIDANTGRHLRSQSAPCVPF